ncbi:MAG: hypothetical protein U0T61_02150 [Buchnera aphidicola (Melaphis rhois)]
MILLKLSLIDIISFLFISLSIKKFFSSFSNVRFQDVNDFEVDNFFFH